MSKLTYAMVGGGPGSMIGEAHREGVLATNLATLVAACFSQHHEKTLALGKELGLSPDRLYRDYKELVAAESRRADKIDFAVVCTPNSSHYEVCKAFLENGISVSCDKPLCLEISEAIELRDLAKAKNAQFCVTFTYTAYPSVKHIRELVKEGVIGDVTFVNAEYPQEWLSRPVEREGNIWAEWRCDPARSGKVNTTGDIGSHVVSIVKTMTGLTIKNLSASLNTLVPGRPLDDTMTAMVNYTNGVHGLYWACQAIIGYDNDLRVRIAGTKGTIVWDNTKCDQIEIMRMGGEKEVIDVPFPTTVSNPKFKAFVKIYTAFVTTLWKLKKGETPTAEDLDFPTVELGLEAVVFMNKCLESSQSGKWMECTE